MEEKYSFLNSIVSKGKHKYKRVSRTPIRYAGGKSNAVGLIIEHIPDHVFTTKKIVSPFIGGGSVEVVLAQEFGFEVVAYHIFDILTQCWKHLVETPSELAYTLSKLVPDKEHFTKYRAILFHYWLNINPNLNYKQRNPIDLSLEEESLLTKDSLSLSAYYYYNMQLSYGPMFLGWPSSVYLDVNKYERIVERFRNFKVNQKEGSLRVECKSFDKVIESHPKDFLYLDPPYYLEGGKMFKGLYPNCNFAIHHKNFDHELLATLLKKHQGGFILTYNNCQWVRETYKDFQLVFPEWQYTFGQGEKRIGKNRIGKTNVKESHEIFIIKI